MDPMEVLRAGSFKRTVLQATIDKAVKQQELHDENQARRIASNVGKLFD